MKSKLQYFGIDGCRAGWFYVGIDQSGSYEFGIVDSIEGVSRFLDQAKLILIDIPIGLLSSGPDERLCDKAARQSISPRGSSVFPAPTRSALAKRSYIEASEENYRSLGRRLSKQSWAILPKIREVDEFLLSAQPGSKIREMHPEVAFWALNQKRPMQFSKKKVPGQQERLELLAGYWGACSMCFAEAIIEFPRNALAIDDILDAMVGAVTASHYPNLATLPENPATDECGLPMEMVYAIA